MSSRFYNATGSEGLARKATSRGPIRAVFCFVKLAVRVVGLSPRCLLVVSWFVCVIPLVGCAFLPNTVMGLFAVSFFSLTTANPTSNNNPGRVY